jgi:hypothetical protein
MKLVQMEQYESMLARGFRVIGEGKPVTRPDGSNITPVWLRRNGFRDQRIGVIVPPEPVEDISVTAAIADAESMPAAFAAKPVDAPADIELQPVQEV